MRMSNCLAGRWSFGWGVYANKRVPPPSYTYDRVSALKGTILPSLVADGVEIRITPSRDMSMAAYCAAALSHRLW